MEQVIIGVDPHKLSATIEVVDPQEKFLGSGRFTTDQAGYTAMRKYAKSWPDRVWAVEGANGAGRPLAQRLLEAGEHVVDVPAKLAARVRLFDTGHNRKTDARDAHSIAVVAVRTTGSAGPQGRRRARGAADADRPPRGSDPAPGPDRVTGSRRCWPNCFPARPRRTSPLCRPRAMLAGVRPRDIAGKTRRRIAAEELSRADRHRRQDQEGHRRAQDHGPGPRLTTDGPARCRTRGRRPDPGRRRRRRPGSPTATGSPPGPAPHPWTPPPGSRTDTGSPGPGTGG